MTSSSTKPLLLWIAFFSFISMGLNGSALGVAWLYMQESFGKTLESLGVLLLANTLGGLVISFYGGGIISRLGIGLFSLLGACLGVLGLLSISLIPFWFGVVLGMFILGLGRAGINTGMNTFVAVRYNASRMNWLHAIFGVGSTLGPLLVTFTVVDLGLGWQHSYLILAVIHLPVLLLFAVTLKDWQLEAKSKTLTGKPSMGSSLRLVSVWLGIILFIVHTGLQMSSAQLSNNLFVQARNIDPKTAGLWISSFWAFITLGRLFWGAMVEHLGEALVLRFCTFGTILGALLLWWQPVPMSNLFALVLMGFTLAPVFPTSVSRTPLLVGLSHSPNAIGFQMAGSALGGALIPGLIGYAADRLGLYIIPLALVLISILQFLAHEGLNKHERQQALLQRG